MKKQESATFAKQSLNINTLIMKTIVKLKTIVIIWIDTEVLHIAH